VTGPGTPTRPAETAATPLERRRHMA